MNTRRATLKAHHETLRRHPWLWGVTGRWFPGKDVVKEVVLTPRSFRRMQFERITNGGASFHVLEVYEDGSDIQVKYMSEGRSYARNEPEPAGRLIDVLMRYHPQNVLYISKLEFNKKNGRTITVFKPPCGFKTISEFAVSLLS